MSKRLLGLLLIIRAFATVIAVVIIALAGIRIATLAQDVVEEPLQEIEREVAVIERTLDSAQRDIEEAQRQIEALGSTLSGFQIPNFLPNINANISLPSINIPDLNVPIVPTVDVEFTNATGSVSRFIEGTCREVTNFIPFIGDVVETICDAGRTVTEAVQIRYPSGISFGTTNFRIDFPTIPSISIPTPQIFLDIRNGLNSLFGGFDVIFEEFRDAFDEINRLRESVDVIPQQIEDVVTTWRTLTEAVGGLIVEWMVFLPMVTLLAGLIIVYYYVSSILGSLLTGLALLFGREPKQHP